ncbi:MAG: rhomboid family intramembrane serine protease [Deltaproteobacteria bacterium]|nr:rhomboid family intramembrane serine protease [Deltaproteobacteria bacterium]
MNASGTSMRFGPPFFPDVIKGLLIANIAVYLLQKLLPIQTQFGLMLTPAAFWGEGALWQIFTYMWLHSSGSIWHLVFNMLALWMFGSDVAAHWGTRRFLRFYLLCGVGAGLIIAGWPALLLGFQVETASWFLPTVGASGAIYGVLLAHSLLFPNRTILLIFPPIPLRAIYLIPFLFLMELLAGDPGVSHAGHIGGVLVGWLLLWRAGEARGLSLSRLRWHYRRWRMRRNLRAVRMEDRRRGGFH